MEEWKFIDGTNKMFAISNYGRLKSFRSVKEGKILLMTNKKNGYFSVILVSKGCKTIYTRIHCLVAKYFISERPSGYIVHHIDGNKQNNNVNNLVYLSNKEHYKESLIKNPQIVSGMNNYNKYIRPKKILQLDVSGNIMNEFNNSNEAHIKTGVCARNILQVANKTEYSPGRIRSQAGGFVWKFK